MGIVVQRVFPTLRIHDLERAAAFYVDGLGFRIDWQWRHEPGSPAFLQLSREGLGFYLSEHEGDAQPGGLVHLYVDDVDAWHEAACQRGLEPESDPVDQPWGNREFRLRDPFGNQICIASVLRSGR